MNYKLSYLIFSVYIKYLFLNYKIFLVKYLIVFCYINNYDDIPNNKIFNNKSIINGESQSNLFVTKNNNNEFNNEKEFKNLGNEEKKYNFIQNNKKGNGKEDDVILNYLRKTKKFIDEISSDDIIDYEVDTIEKDIDKREDNINRKINENNKSKKTYADSNIKTRYSFYA